MLKKLLIITMIALSSMHLFDVQANSSVLSQLPKAVQQRLYERLNNQEDDAITETKIKTSNPYEKDFFGFSVSIDGTTLVVGAQRGNTYSVNEDNEGSVYVYDLNLDNNHPDFEREIRASDGEDSNHFGRSVAIDGTTLVVSASGGLYNSGAVYVYDLNLDNNHPGFEHKITASEGISNDKFGYTLALHGTTLVVGAHFDDAIGSTSGSVYVYDLNLLEGNAYTPGTPAPEVYSPEFERKITASDGAASDRFGESVAIDGTTLVVGAPGDDDNDNYQSGSVYVYDLTKDGNVSTPSTPATPYEDEFERKITSSDFRNDNFGHSVAIEGTTLVVGIYTSDSSNSGAVYVYDLNKTSEDSNFERKIKASDLSIWFGYSVALHGTTLVVGAPNDDDNGDSSGSVYVYDLTLDGNAETTGNPATPYVDGFERKIIASDGSDNDHFGWTVRIVGTSLVVGAHYEDNFTGSVYIYNGTFGSGTTKTDEEWASEMTTMIELLTEPYVRADVEAARDAYDALTPEQQALISAETYQTLLDAEQALADIDAVTAVYVMIDALSEPYDRADVEAARDAYDALTPEQKTMISNLTGTYQKLLDAEQALADIDAASIVDGMIAALSELYDAVAVSDARQAYDALTPEQQALITAETYQKLLDAEQALADIDAASIVEGMIDALSEPYVRADVEAAGTAYDALTTEQQALITAETYQTLLDAEQALTDIDAAAAVDAMIDALTDPYDIDAIDAARDAYENLTEAQKALVTGLTDLEEAEQRYADIDAASIVDGMIAALSEPYDAVAVSDARLAYDALTEIQKGYVTRLPELEAAEQALADINAAAAVDALIDALTSPYVRADVEAARDAYNNLTETQQALVTNYQDLLNAEQVLSDIDAAAAVDALIDALTSPYLRADVEAARDAYDALTETQQALVTGLLDLENAEAAVEERVNKEEATRIDALILTLTEDSTEEEIEAAREAYENLTEEQQALVTELPTLETYEEQVAPQDATGIIFFMLIFIGVISAVIYFGFYKRDREEKKNKYE